MKRRVLPPGILLLGVLTAACGGESAETGGRGEPIVRDSAGVRLVENGEAPQDGWRVGGEPLFTLGWGPDDPAFTGLQSGHILPDGGALVGDYRTGTIYRIGPHGSLMDTWGRKGEGPGEYQSLDAILSRGDSIIVADSRLRRLTLLSPDGELRSTRRLPGPFLYRASTILADGRLLLIPEGYESVSETRREWVFETQPILATLPDGGGADTLADLPHLRRWYGTRGASPGPIRVEGRAGGFAGGFAWARSDEREVRWYDGAGSLVQIVRWEEESAPLTAEWRQRFLDNFENGARSHGLDDGTVAARLRELEEELDRHGGPLPYWNSLHVDREGNAWLGRYPLLAEPPGAWRVIARDGTFEGWVDLPGVAYIIDITDDRILGVRLNELDVPAVVMLELIRP